VPRRMPRFEKHKQKPYKLVSQISFFDNGLMGEFDGVAEAVEHGIFMGLPGEEFEIVRASDGVVMVKLTAPESKLSLLDTCV